MAKRLQITLDVQGMTCDGCARQVTSALGVREGVHDVKVPTWQSGRATLVVSPGVTDEVLIRAVASVGVAEAAARKKGLHVQPAALQLKRVPRALAARDTRGLFKLVAEEATGKLLGVHILAAEAGEVIQAATIALRFGLRVEDLVETFCPYLTMAEGLKLAALTFKKDVARLSCCAA